MAFDNTSRRPRFANVMSSSSKRRRSSSPSDRPSKSARRDNDASSRTVIYHHPEIGDMKTIQIEEETRQFLGIQYATLKDRFASPEIRQYTHNEALDCTKLGSQALHIPNGPDMEQKLIQHALPYDEDVLSASDTDGLNLNVTVPTNLDGELDTRRRLPVFVYIHGGGFQSGSAMWPQYDMTKFASLSRQQQKPIIAVAINYRLGAAGLLTSEELRREGYKANNSILDQRAALLWIQKYIAGFGGDPCNVTIAGPVSVSYHLQSNEALFKRAIVLSVTSLQLRPIPAKVAETSYQTALELLGLQSSTKEEALERLLAVNAQELRQKLQKVALAPVADETIPLEAHTFMDVYDGKTKLGAREWCESLILGDCQFDGSIFGLRLAQRKSGIARAFCSSIRSSFSYTPSIGEQLLDAYDLDSDTPDEMALQTILKIGTDVAFYAPTIAFAEGLHDTMKVFMYRFNEPNPWEGPWKGRATHALDVHFLLQNFNQYLEPPQQKLAEDMAGNFFAFMYGSDPWSEWTCDEPIAKTFGPDGHSVVVSDEAGKNGRRGIIWDLAQSADIDSLFGAFMSFLREQPKRAPQQDRPPQQDRSPQQNLPAAVPTSNDSKVVSTEVALPSDKKNESAELHLHRRLEAVEDFLNELRGFLQSNMSHSDIEQERALHNQTMLELASSREKAIDMERKLQRLQAVVSECMITQR